MSKLGICLSKILKRLQLTIFSLRNLFEQRDTPINEDKSSAPVQLSFKYDQLNQDSSEIFYIIRYTLPFISANHEVTIMINLPGYVKRFLIAMATIIFSHIIVSDASSDIVKYRDEEGVHHFYVVPDQPKSRKSNSPNVNAISRKKEYKGWNVKGLSLQNNPTRRPIDPSGDNITEVYEKMSRLSTKKDAFEKTEDFSKRMKMLGNNSKYVFKIANDCFGSNISYDADKETLTIKLTYGSSMNIYGKDHYRPSYLTIKKTRKDGDPYIGSNAFGAKKVVDRMHVTVYAISPSLSMPFLVFDQIAIKLPLPEAKLLRVRNDIGLNLYNDIGVDLYAVCVPRFSKEVGGFAMADYHTSEPTLTYPTELTEMIHAINVDIVEYWVVNRSNDNIMLVHKFR